MTKTLTNAMNNYMVEELCNEMLEQEQVAQYGTAHEQHEAIARLKEIDEELETLHIPNNPGPEFPNINDYLYKVQ